MRIWCYQISLLSDFACHSTVPQSAIRSFAMLLLVSSNGASDSYCSRNIDNKAMHTDYQIAKLHFVIKKVWIKLLKYDFL